MANYVNNRELLAEVKICKEAGAMSDKLAKMLILIVDGASSRMRYANELDREDCKGMALYDLVRYWHKFDTERYSNPFAYFTQIAKFGFAKQWKITYPDKYKGTLSLDRFYHEADSATRSYI